ncbi:surface antigen [Azospirillum fermentarium]|uniref:RT0821/Lpp0805 family surface protein n=1 Tax=Azospirillum fermentarium TaxID=1233114 RepID=UPI002225C348|nr:RT0821/Lpp0805 family surface protein [Azospirillum fermentarium]MCW2248766.1 surface antigen [Azospirillum fermentarium]
MKARKPLIAAVAATALLAGCANPGGYNDPYGGSAGISKQTGGAVLGGIVGGVAGSRFGGGAGKLVAVGVGTLLGAALGSAAGASLDRADATYARQAEMQAYGAPIGQTVRWNNPQNGNWGSYTPLRDGYASSGDYCREYQTTISVGGQLQRANGTACRQADGSWRIVG